MIFSSFEFLLFLPIVLALYYASSSVRYRNWMLLLASTVFYAAWDPRFLLLLYGTTIAEWFIGARIFRADSRTAKRLWLATSLTMNLGSLVLYKYADFFILSFRDVLAAFDVHVEVHTLNLILPLGISFTNFQNMTYSLDIYRGELKPHRSVMEYALFVVFFPQLVAGPIVRAVELVPQITRGVNVSWDDVVVGVNRFLEGFTKKVLVADNLAPYVDRIFSDPGAYDGLTLWCGSIGFAVQCYCDFAGYSDMAIGCGRLMGFWMPENFRWPFLATSVADFWRRWHITLYSFMRDYLYVALGGSRVRAARQVFNAMITMTLVGLWHGAAWNFVVWGVYNGALVVGYRFVALGLQRAPALGRALGTLPGTVLRIAVTDVLFFLSFALFRSEGSLANALRNAWRMLTFDGTGQRSLDPWVPLAFGAVILGSLACESRLGERLGARLAGRPVALPLQVLGYGTLIYVLLLFCPHDTQAFVYFQF